MGKEERNFSVFIIISTQKLFVLNRVLLHIQNNMNIFHKIEISNIIFFFFFSCAEVGWLHRRDEGSPR